MGIIIRSFMDRKSNREMFRVIMHTEAGDMSMRPVESLTEAMDNATVVCRQFGLPHYGYNGRFISVPKAA